MPSPPGCRSSCRCGASRLRLRLWRTWTSGTSWTPSFRAAGPRSRSLSGVPPHRRRYGRPPARLESAFADTVGLRNGIYSYRKEIDEERGVGNAVLALRRFLGGSLQQAVDVAYALFEQRVEEFTRIAEQGPEPEPDGEHAGCVRALCDGMAGDNEWYRHTDRYGPGSASVGRVNRDAAGGPSRRIGGQSSGAHGTAGGMSILPAVATVALLVSGLPAGAAAPPLPPPSVRGELDGTLRAVHEAGAFGVYSAVRDRAALWKGAAGVADVRTGRPVHPGMHHRVGSVTKTFTAVAVLQLVGDGRIGLDAAVADFLPGLVADGLDPAVTVRMLLNHTSGIADYYRIVFPGDSPTALDENRFREFRPGELAGRGLAAPATGAPGERYRYSNTNYILAGLLLERVTGNDAERHITDRVIRRAGLENTYFPRTPFVEGPHSRMYDSLFGLIDPPRDYSVYDMSWAWTAGALISTTDDLTRFHAALFGGELLAPAELGEMLTAVPIGDVPPHLPSSGLGVQTRRLSCGAFWGHDGGTTGAYTLAYASADGERQASVGINRLGYQTLDEEGWIKPHPIDTALLRHLDHALCGGGDGPKG
ncbi:serine hydrolase [Streptomyces amakusaensis]|uniref:Serine hydrolase n=1 Tax=Streptomyces amakusaensis TaxID=67271 RepID=A0ABW0ANH8_9ACTN